MQALAEYQARASVKALKTHFEELEEREERLDRELSDTEKYSERNLNA